MDAVLDTSDRVFSGEEGHGKYLDLHTHYMSFCNIKKLRQLNLIKADDYLTWIQNLDKFALVPLYIKQSSKYDNYVAELSDYLKDFFQRTQPLVDFKTIVDQTDEMFEAEWDQRSLFGWETFISRIVGEAMPDSVTKNQLHCGFCNKTFLNESVFHFHKKGKRHIKAVNTSQTKKVVETEKRSSEFTTGQIQKLMQVARSETWILRLKALMADVWEQTMNQVRKKQSSSFQELEAERATMTAREILAKTTMTGGGDSDEEDGLKYNPKNLPMGWDGKPIPYWLYKLHGLG